MLITPTQANIQSALRSFLLAVLPAGVPVIAGQSNRVPEPMQGKFVVMTPIRFKRLATNLDTYSDIVFEGSVAGDVLTVTTILRGTVRLDLTLFGVDVIDGTRITAQLTGIAGGVGTYRVSQAQTIAARTLAAGYMAMQQDAEVTVQLDFHGDDTTAGDLAQIASTAIRDDYGVRFFAGLAPPMNGVAPLHADDPRQMPFINAEQQYEWRWVLEACLQANQVAITPMQFARAVEVGLIEVDGRYPP
jgi:hypothetical protein